MKQARETMYKDANELWVDLNTTVVKTSKLFLTKFLFRIGKVFLVRREDPWRILGRRRQ
jgi:hypothetical protein